jgi:hypothetical protein
MQTLSVILSLICRVAMVGLALFGLVSYLTGGVPAHPSQEWMVLAACDGLAFVAPLTKYRNPAVLAGLVTLGANYWYRHYMASWIFWYTGIAIVLVLLPRYMRKPKKERR